MPCAASRGTRQRARWQASWRCRARSRLQFNAYKIPLMRNLVKRAIGGVEEATWAS